MSAEEIQADSLRRLARASEHIGKATDIWAKGSTCQNCKQRPATHNWIGDGGALALSHGFASRWCEFCVVTAQLAHARTVVDSIPALEARRLELGKLAEVSPPSQEPG